MATKQLSQVRLSIPEEDGTLARELGLVPKRQCQPPRQMDADRVADPASIFHVHALPIRQR